MRWNSDSRVETNLLAMIFFCVLFGWGVEIPVSDSANAPLWPVLAALPSMALLFRRKRVFGALGLGLAVASTILVHKFVEMSVIPQLALIRSILSMLVLAFSIGLLYGLVSSLRQALVPATVLAIKFFIVVQLAFMFVEMALGFQLILGGAPKYPHYFLLIHRASGLFAEPSHLAIALATPLCFFLAFTRVWFRHFGWPYSVGLGLIVFLCPSVTLIAVVAISLMIRGLLSRRDAVLVAVTVVSIAAATPLLVYEFRSKNEVADRLSDTYAVLKGRARPESVNVSTLVFFKAIHVARRSLSEVPFGFGYDNTALANSRYGREYTGVLFESNGTDLASMPAKMIVDFGWFGFATVMLTVYSLGWGIVVRRNSDIGMWSALMLAQFLSSFVRSNGYLQQGIALVLATVLVLLLSRVLGSASPQAFRRRSPPVGYRVRGARLSVSPHQSPLDKSAHDESLRYRKP